MHYVLTDALALHLSLPAYQHLGLKLGHINHYVTDYSETEHLLELER